MKVENMESSKGNKVPNQFIIYADDGTAYFQSYSSVICRKKWRDDIVLDKNKWDYSKTTMKYLALFLGMSPKDIRQKVKDGVFILDNLN